MSGARLENLVRLASRLDADAERDRAALWRRDREIGRSLASLRDRPAAQLAAWLDRVEHEPGQAVPRLATAWRWITLLLVMIGLALGWGVATALFDYDGTHPVNVVNVLGVFVGLQLLLLIPLAVAAVRRDLVWFSPARLAELLVHVLPARLREELATFVGLTQRHEKVYGRVQKWALLRWSQLFAIAFNIGALLHFVLLIALTDLAFAWSTTLDASPQTVHAIGSALALPWRFWNDAVPSLELVEATQYFRLGSPLSQWREAAETPELFGRWWPFVLLCMAMYGLLPRIVAFVVADWRFHLAVRWTFTHTPGAADVLDRLNSPFVETRAIEPSQDEREDVAADPAPAPEKRLPGTPRFIINWASVPLDDESLRQHLSLTRAPVHHCGGARSIEEDRATISHAAAADDTSGGVIVAVKSWEPPMLETIDFLGDLRRAVGEGVSIAVVPIALDGELNPAHLADWQRHVARAGDPWMEVSTRMP